MDQDRYKAKAALLDAYMRTGDLGALVKAYTDLKAQNPTYQKLNRQNAYEGYGYFDCGCEGESSGSVLDSSGNRVYTEGTGSR
jgi:hypothetical protein